MSEICYYYHDMMKMRICLKMVGTHQWEYVAPVQSKGSKVKYHPMSFDQCSIF